MYSVRIVAAIGLLASLAGGAQAQDLAIPLVKMEIDGNFSVEEGKPPAIDISGMGCVPLQGDIRTCLVINDENKAAQFATIGKDGIAVGGPIPLIGNKPDPKTFGSAPNETCNKVDDFADLDGEGVAYAAPFFYVVGSHGCGRTKNKFRESSFILARVRVDAQGRPVNPSGRLLEEKEFSSAVETTYRVSDLLKASPVVAGFFARDLEGANGLNIEGVAVDGDQIWFGLRGPVTPDTRKPEAKGDRAFIVGGSVADLFSKNPSGAAPTLKSFDLSGLGIRDLAMLPDKRLLVLAGAGHGEEVLFKLYVADPIKETVKPIGTLATVTGPGKKGKIATGKAEGVTLLDVTGGAASAVFLFDGIADGSPHLAKFAIPGPD
jgi:hypothetical protein